MVAGIPGLRYLSMRQEQWRALTESTGRPPGLAAAVLTDTSSPAALATWAKHLDGSDDDFRCYAGRLPEDG